MKKISLSLFTVALILTGLFIFAGCEKEEATSKNTLNIQKSKKSLPSLQAIAAVMGVDADRIISITHKTGTYEGHDEDYTDYYPDGTIKSHIHKHWYICHPYDAYCCSVVRVRTELKVGATGVTGCPSNGYIVELDNGDIAMFFDHVQINAPYIDGGSLVIAADGAPIANAHTIGLCNEQEFVKILEGNYAFQDFENYRYCIIPADHVEIVQAQLQSMEE